MLKTQWWWMESAANQSPSKFPLTGKNTGKKRDLWAIRCPKTLTNQGLVPFLARRSTLSWRLLPQCFLNIHRFLPSVSCAPGSGSFGRRNVGQPISSKRRHRIMNFKRFTCNCLVLSADSWMPVRAQVISIPERTPRIF